MIVIVDYQLGNLRSIWLKIQRMGFACQISRDHEVIRNATKLILPGVGHFAKGMQNLQEMGLLPVLHETVIEQGKPVLGICLGMQLLTLSSEEGNVKGLGWIPVVTTRFPPQNRDGTTLRIPHVGWATLTKAKESPLLQDLEPEARFYFTHSYRVPCQQEEASYAVALADYGEPFVAILQKERICGTQFHPEKSHVRGMKIIENFINYV